MTNSPTVPLETPPFIELVLTEFEKKSDFNESDLSFRLETAIKANSSCTDDQYRAAVAEYIASAFAPGTDDGWNTFFGPESTMNGRKHPDISQVDPSVIRYWQSRMEVARHPVLRARYADLVWDLSKPAANLKPPIEACRIAIDMYVAASRLADGATLHHAEDRLERAISLALSIGDMNRIESSRDALIDLVRRFPGDRQWAMAFDLLFDNPKVALSDEGSQALIDELERIVTRVAKNPSGAGSIETMEVAKRLAKVYSSKAQPDDAKRVILACGQAIERLSDIAHGMASVTWLGNLHAVYKEYGLRDDADRVLVAMKRKGAEAEDAMVPISFSATIDRKELDDAVESMTADGVASAFSKLVGTLIPTIDAIKARAAELRGKHPLYEFFAKNKVKIGEQQIIARVGSAEDDLEGWLIHEMAESMSLSSFFLSQVIDRIRNRYSVDAETVVTFVRPSPFIEGRDIELIREGVDAYLACDFVKAIHVLVPRIEHALRSLLGLLGRPTAKPRREHTTWFVEKSLKDILEHEPIMRRFLGDDATLYLRAFLVDPRGLNVRNRLSHGLMYRDHFRRQVADRVLHILLLLGAIGRKLHEDDRTEPEA